MNRTNLKENLKIAAVLISLFLAIALPISIAYISLTATINLPTSGVTSNAVLELYYMNMTSQTSLNWGTTGNGTYTQQSILKNTGNTDLTLSMTTDEELSWLEQTWDQNTTVIVAGGEVPVTWTLTLTDAPEGVDFNYMTTITGTET